MPLPSPQAETTGVALPRPWRPVVALLAVALGLGFPLIFALVLLANDPPITPDVLAELIALHLAIPWLLLRLIQFAYRASFATGDATLVVRSRGLTIEIPLAAIASVSPWRFPFPLPGFTLELRSGRKLSHALATPDLARLVGAIRGSEEEPQSGAVAWAAAKHAWGSSRWYHGPLKILGFGLFPTAVLFRVDQIITYGGTFGQYYLAGPGPYFESFLTYWGAVSGYLIVYAGTWRSAAEVSSLAATAVRPARAAACRRLAERACQVAYYGGVPLLLGLRFLPY